MIDFDKIPRGTDLRKFIDEALAQPDVVILTADEGKLRELIWQIAANWGSRVRARALENAGSASLRQKLHEEIDEAFDRAGLSNR